MTPVALHEGALGELAAVGIAVPTYDRSRLVARIVHIGVGGFHRSHLAAYCDELANAGSDWGICGVNLLEHDRRLAEVLTKQNGLYCLVVRDGSGAQCRVVGSIVDYVHAVDDDQPVVDRVARPDTEIVSLTITEAGYTDDVRNRRTFDVIARGLERRRDDGVGGVTILSCDNLLGNGRAARRCVLDAATRLGGGLAAWIDERCTFPDSMVDRITPATTDDDRRLVAEEFGLVDGWPVIAEPFRQWVVEDRFAAGQPDLEAVGVVLTDDVTPWERYKLRLLNAGHSAIAHLGVLRGFVHVDEALADTTMHDFLEGFLRDESAPTVTELAALPIDGYVTTVLERFANPAIRDRLSRLCVDATAKMRTFVAPIIIDALDRNLPVTHCATVLAAWARYLTVVPLDDQATDPGADTMRELARSADSDPGRFIAAAIGTSAPVDTRLVDAFATALREVDQR